MVFAFSLLFLAQIGGVIGGGGGTVQVPAIPQIVPLPIYNYGSSVLDHDGNLLVMDVMYSPSPMTAGQPVVMRLPGTMKTRITPITNLGVRLPSREYDGSFQVMGIGRNAVYAIVTTYSAITTTTREESAGATATAIAVAGPIWFTTDRTLVSLRLGRDGLPASLPKVEVPLRADVKISAADVAGGMDTIAFADNISFSRILVPPPDGTSLPAPVGAEPRTARLYKSDGNSFITVTANPIPLP
jgi:hypothetical protein